MTTQPIANGDSSTVAPATPAQTQAALIARSNRAATPLAKTFIQNPDRSLPARSAPLATFVRNRDHRGLLALLFLHTIISSGDGPEGWSTTLPLPVWARALGITRDAEPRSAATATTKILSRLVDRELVTRSRAGRDRQVTLTLRDPSGNGEPYQRPTGTPSSRFIRINNAFWTDGWHERLTLAETVMLLVALHEKPTFTLSTEHMPRWYGWSADTAERGFTGLQSKSLLSKTQVTEVDPLSRIGVTTRNRYTLQAPFDATTVDLAIAARPRPATREEA